MAAGRPTDYTPTLVKKARAYLASLPKDEVVHSIEGLADHLGISRSTIYEWVKNEDKREFSDIVEKVMTLQGKSLINGSLANKLNAPISKLMLSKHGYRDSQDITSDGKAMPTPIYGGTAV